MVPGPHQDVLEDAAEGLVRGESDDLALASLASVIECGQRSDRRVDADGEGVLVAVELEWRRVDIA